MIGHDQALARPAPAAQHGPRGAGGRRVRWWHPRLSTRRALTGMALVAPTFAMVAVFVLFPLGFAVYISLTNWPLIGPYHYIGGQNYSLLVHDPQFIHSVLFTLLYTGIVTVPIFVVGYAMAVLVRSNRRGATFFRTAFFLPFIIGLATESFMVLLELQPDSGAADYVLGKIGLAHATTAWTVNYGLALTAICVFVVWFASGLTMMLLMAGMQGIPAELYEAADVDGGTWWQKESRITLPLLRPNIALALIISVIGSFLAFNQFYILTEGGPGTSTEPVVMWIYEEAFVQYHLGYATAGAIALVIVIAIISAAQFYLLRDGSKASR
ncbi:MAG TPA: sugar ABC transporter permease [Trebonia sp.]|nr:sugar ABC transporter permease [Trebonia sp.]